MVTAAGVSGSGLCSWKRVFIELGCLLQLKWSLPNNRSLRSQSRGQRPLHRGQKDTDGGTVFGRKWSLHKTAEMQEPKWRNRRV